MPKISVLMTAFNETAQQVDAALTSLVRQTEADFEILLVLDAPDNTALKTHLEQWQTREPRLHLTVNTANAGLASSLNVALTQAKAPYCARMDADDIAMPERFATQLAILTQTGWDVLSGNASFIDEEGQVTGEHDWIPEQPQQLAQLLPVGNNLIHPAVMLKTESIRKVGGYRRLQTAEDYDLWLRLLKAGAQIGATNTRLLQYRVRRNSMTQSDRYRVFLVSQYLRACYQRPAYPAEATQLRELAQQLESAQADSPTVSQRFSTQVQALSQGKQALKKGRFFAAMKLVVPPLRAKQVRAYARQARTFARLYQRLRAANQGECR